MVSFERRRVRTFAITEINVRIEDREGAAAIPGIHPSTLRAKMHKLGIIRSETKGPDQPVRIPSKVPSIY